MNEIITYSQEYLNKGMVCFTAVLNEEVKKNGEIKKELKLPIGWNKLTIETAKKKINTKHNALCIVTGKVSGIIVIDWDLYKDDKTQLKYNELINKYGKPETKINKSGKGGEHWYFKYDENKHSKIKSHSDTRINGKKYGVDIRTNGGCIIAPPSRYLTIDKEIRQYTEITTFGKLMEVPEWIYNSFDEFNNNENIMEEDSITEQDEEEEIKPSDSISNIDNETKTITNVSYPTIFNYHLEVKNDLMILLECLGKDRVDNYDDWLKVGFSLHSIKHMDTLEIWREWSKKSKKYVEGECEKIWLSMKNKEVNGNICSMGTLKYMAKNDNPILYSRRFVKTNIFKEAMKIFNNYNVANLLFTYFDNCYMYDNKYENWFELRENKTWNMSRKAPTSLLQIIQKDLIDKIYAYIGELSKIAPSVDLDHSKNINELIKKCVNNTTILGSSMFINGVMQCAKFVFDNDNVTIKMDTNRDIFAFSNKIYELKTGKIRDIQAEDLITITTNYEYPTYNEDSEKEVLEFIHSIFENEEVEKYLLTTLASSLLGYKRFEEFYVWSGKGRNGKGSLTELIKSAFGDYFKTIDKSFFTKLKKSSNEATPELADKKNCRILISTEPEKTEQLMASKLKQITGNDEIHCRELYQNEVISFVPQFNLILQTNNIPTLSKVDYAVKARMRIIKFPFVFTSKPEEEHERLGKTDLKEKQIKTTEWRDALILILIKYYEKYVRGANYLEVPKMIENEANEYFDKQNPLAEWFNTYIERKKNSSVGSTELYNHYMELTEGNTSYQKISTQKFSEYMSVLGYESRKTKTIRVYEGLNIKEIKEI